MPSRDQLTTLRREIELDLEPVAGLRGQLDEARVGLHAEAEQRDLAYVGYLLHGIYTGWESGFRRIAATFENRLDPAQWHAQLLRRMAVDVPGMRPAVIDRSRCASLEKLRSFRYFFRHSYGASLRPDELSLVPGRYDEAAPHMDASFAQFLTQVDDIADQADQG